MCLMRKLTARQMHRFALSKPDIRIIPSHGIFLCSNQVKYSETSVLLQRRYLRRVLTLLAYHPLWVKLRLHNHFRPMIQG